MELLRIILILIPMLGISNAAAPVWTSPSADGESVLKDENIPVGTSIFELGATGDNALTYTIQSQTVTDQFELNGTTLQLKTLLDYETDTSHELVFSVTDGGNGANGVNSVTFTVNVNDVDDESPVFDPATYTKDVQENTAADTSVLTVTATDGDVTLEFKTITYSIKSGNTNDNFVINGSTGVLSTTANAINFSDGSPINLVVSAKDAVDHEDTAQVTITVKTKPSFAAPSGGSTTVSISENSAADTSVYDVQASDSDGDNVTITIANQSTGDNFKMSGSQLQVNSGATLDFESGTTSYTVRFQAQDADGNVVESDDLTVNIDNVNEFNPVFNSTSYTKGIKEQSEVHSNFLQVTAADGDSGDTVAYSITGDAGPFVIDSTTGYLSTNAAIEYTDQSSYSLTVTGTDSGGLTGTASVTVNVIEATNPVFTLPSEADGETIDISEDTVLQTSFYQISATDSDGDTLEYFLTKGSPEFSLDPATRVVKVESTLDYDTDPKSYELEFEARDQNSATSTATLTVSLTDVNDNSPVFIETPYTAQALEGQTSSTQIFQVTATDADSSSDDNNVIQYSITGGNTDNKFTIDDSSGWISASNLHFGTLSSYTLEVAAKDKNGAADALVTTANVTVSVVTEPVWETPVASNTEVNMNEDIAVGGSVYTLLAKDEDGDTVIYSIISQTPEDMFTLNGSQIISGSKPFDADGAEAVTSYTLGIRVSDGSHNTDSSIVINVVDVNDEPPVFAPSSYTKDLLENVPSGTSVLTVTATDADTNSTFNTLTYSITDGDTNNNFVINGSTGLLSTTTNAISFSDGGTIILVVAARDAAGNEDTAQVTITVKTKPSFAAPSGGSTTVSISENSAADTSVYDAQASDSDGDNVTITIANQSTGDNFKMSGSQLQVNSGATLDFESGTTSYTVRFQAQDVDGNVVESDDLTVNIDNVNEFSPVFIPTSYTEDIKEQSEVHSSFLQVTATDGDSGETVTYSITGSVGPFVIDSSTGYLSTNAAIVYTDQSSYSLTVTGTDSGGLTGTASVTVNVIEATSPVFTLPSEADGATIDISEDTDLQTSIYQISATDSDGDTILYFLTKGSSEFSLDTTTRVVKVASTLDYDTDPKSYELEFEARDQNSESSTATLTVSLTDVNDNSPVFIETPYTAQALEGQTSSTQIFQVTATDADSSSDDNNVIQYSITGGNTDNKFTIDDSTGWISASNLHFGTTSSYTLEITAKDKNGAADALVTTADITVSVVTEPVWSKPPTPNTPVNMNENVQSGSSVYTLEATDADGDQLTYELVSQDPSSLADMFVLSGSQINAGSTAFDADANDAVTSFTLAVRATDGRTSIISSIVVTLVDVNDNDPAFAPTTYTASIWEGASSGTSVSTVTATDADVSSNFNTLTYSIIAGDNANAFTMVGSQINVAGTLDYNATSTYTLTIQASDSTTTDEATVMINLYTKPAWITPPSPNTAVNINENIASGGSVYTLSAADLDGDVVSYLLISQSPDTDMFVLHNSQLNTGTSPFDVDAAGAVTLYTVNVRASAGGDAIDSSILVTINNVNDEVPVFHPATYTKSLWEGEPIGTSVLTVTATDADSGSDFKTISYSITNGNDGNAFEITGNQIKLSALLNFKTKSTYTLTVRAFDGTNHQDATVTINLNTRPVFTSPPQDGDTRDVQENIDSTHTVYSIKVSDADGQAVTTTMSQGPGTKFVLDGNDVKLANGETLDYEAESGPFTLSFTATDESGNAITSDNVLVSLTDVNDNTPTFSSGLFSKTMKTTDQVGTTVQSFVATDADGSDANNQITYSINDGNTNTDFDINASGVVTILNSLTMSTPNYNLEIYAVDNGSPPRTGSTTLSVAVSEPSDPSFTTPPAEGASIAVPENQTVNSVVYTLVASDADGDNLQYSIKSSTPSSKFTLSGAHLQVATALDYETEKSFTLIFEVDDDDGVSSNKATSSALNITITNVNEFTPAFSETKYTKSVTSKINSGRIVLTVSATDSDDGAQITFSITGGNSKGYFSITSQGGEIKTTTDWPVDGDDSSDSADLTVQASDGELSSSVQVEIQYNIATRTPFALSTFIMSLGFYYLFMKS